jgi:hypothetical protein
MIVIHMASKLSNTLHMKGLTCLMVMLTYYLPYTELFGCDEIDYSVDVRRNLGGAVWLLPLDTLIIIMVMIIVSIVGRET